MPVCKICQATDESLFYKSIATYCKDHWKEKVRTNRYANHDYYTAYDRARSVLQHRKEKNKRVTHEYRMTYANRRVANSAVQSALRKGELTKLPCLICGSTKVVGHHVDYDRPLDVVWLCQMHHKQAHAIVEGD